MTVNFSPLSACAWHEGTLLLVELVVLKLDCLCGGVDLCLVDQALAVLAVLLLCGGVDTVGQVLFGVVVVVVMMAVVMRQAWWT